MNALDTNTLIRFLVNDDEAAAKIVYDIFEDAFNNSEQLIVVTPVVLEIIWVLKSRYKFKRDDIIMALEKLCSLSVIRFESFDLVNNLIKYGKTTNIELDDILIGICGRINGCEKTLTLDKDASKFDLFKLIS